jgi:phosphatidylglycerol:prolipoprotein diacylglycerol transferase
MFPIICQIGPLTVYSYGLMLAIAVIVCTYLCRRDAKKIGVDPDIISDLGFWLILSGIIGARIFYIMTFWPTFENNWLEMIMIQHGGLSWQGGLILGTLAGVWYVRRKKLDLLQMCDLVAPYLALGQAIGRIGCFLNGCCYGTPVSWGVYFPSLDEHVHPTQLYDALGLLFIFFVLKWFQKHTDVKGKIFVLYFASAAGLRFVIEFLRGDHTDTYFGLSLYQLVCLGLVMVAFIVNSRLKAPRK